jgi:hypothetical protein
MFDCCHDHLQHSVAIGKHVVIVETQNAIPLGRQKGVSPRIALDVFRLEVLPAVDLDNDVGGVTNKVDDEGTDWRLTSKARTEQPVSAHSIPDGVLRIGGLLSKRSRARALPLRHLPP